MFFPEINIQQHIPDWYRNDVESSIWNYYSTLSFD